MAAKKKKKPAANPARGFATTSIASKPKQEKPTDPVQELPKVEKDAGSTSHDLQDTGAAVRPVDAPSELSPEEFEKQLENDELQLLVEKHAGKVRRESGRQTSRVQTDRRVLRSQAQTLMARDWLPEELMLDILDLANTESNDVNRKADHQSLLRFVTEDEAVPKLWSLQLVFKDLGFSPPRVESALRWLCANATTVDQTSGFWGFQEGLEWLSLNRDEENLLPYEEHKPKSTISYSRESSRPATPAQSVPMASFDSHPPASKEAENNNTQDGHESVVRNTRITGSEASETEVSDIDSDLEPDQLIPKYLKLKARLYDIDPFLVENKTKMAKNKRTRAPPETASPLDSDVVRKLQSQLQQIETDALFDRDAAETLWVPLRNQLAQDAASRRREDIQADCKDPAADSGSKLDDDMVHSPQPRKTTEDLSSQGDEDGELSDTGLLGDMFSAPSDDVPNRQNAQLTQGATDLIVRDFGKQTGISSRRILEETIRARDPHAMLTYKLVSPTTYSSRHALSIVWSKEQDIMYDESIPGVSCDIRLPTITFTATGIACVSEQQSEGFISTVALFSLFSSSVKEEKAYIRLPPNWRELYKEFLEFRKENADAADRQTIKQLRSIVQDQLEHEESSGTILTNRFKMRNQGSGTSSEAGDSSREIGSLADASEHLKEVWRRKSMTEAYQRMHQVRTSLPVFGFRGSILETIAQHQVTIISGETGCGKSTQIPAYILENELSHGRSCKVYCTEPRRISAISLAQRVSEELGESKSELGTSRSLVGYAIRLETSTSAMTRLVYATVGIVLRMLESSRGLDDISHLIVDEVHERSIDTDFLLIVLRSLMLRRPDLKVILMSATVDAQRFSKYLNNAPILTIPGRTFPVETKYLEDAVELTRYTSSAQKGVNDSETSEDEEDPRQDKAQSGIPSKLSTYSSATRHVLANYDEYHVDYQLIVRLIEHVGRDPSLGHYSSAFLVFLPGIAEIRQLNDMLLSHPSFGQDWLVYPLHSTISSDDQQQAFVVPPPGVRKIVLSTNIAETGVTIPDITCVIDTGKHKEMRFDERRQLSRLTQSFISRANAKQRRGRAGRVQEGLCFHLFTKYRHDELMTDQQTPEMLRLSLQDLVMRTKICKLGDIEGTLSEALDPPSSKNIRRAIDALIEVDALTGREDLTQLGAQLAKLPLDAHLGKLVLLSAVYNCIDVGITIAAILSSKSPFLTPIGARQRADAARLGFKKGDSDLLTAYNAYKAWKAVCSTSGRFEVQFCHKNFLSSQNLGNVEDLKSQLLGSVVDAGFVKLSPEERRALSRYRSTSRNRNFVKIPESYDIHSDNEALVNSVVAAAFYPKILIRDGKGWRNIANNQTVSLAPTSVNKGTQTAKFLSYYHILQSSNKYYNAHSTSIAHPLPLVLLAGSDVDFRIHAGIVSLSNNVLRFAVKDWKICVALKVLRERVKDMMSAAWKNPGRTLGTREKKWMEFFIRVFEAEREKSRRLEDTKDIAAGKRR